MRRGLSYLLVFLLGGLAASGLITGRDLLADEPRPPLAEGLPDSANQAEAAWSARLAATFPDGTQEAVVISTLSEQGFRLHIHEGQLWAEFDRHSAVCSESLSATWRKEETGAIRGMAGTVHLSCL